jgi:multiple sugar transport system ATP-binding protein
MIYVTHDQVEAMTMGERIVILKDGVVNQIDSPLNLYNNPVNKFVAEFIGSPAMNFVSGKIDVNEEYYLKLTSDGVKLKLNEEQVKRLLNYRGKELIVGIRPENFKPVIETSPIDILSVTIEVVEPIGNEVYLHFILDSKQMIARINADKNYRTGDKILLQIDTDKLHFFDKATEKAI